MNVLCTLLIVVGLLPGTLGERLELSHVVSRQEAKADPFEVPYDLQQGAIRYAPMQAMPPTAITATKTLPLWPTSSSALASTFLPAPIIQTTVTQAITYNGLSHVNTVATQTRSVGDMERFLNRWRD